MNPARISDPLRSARQFVRAARFADAILELDRQRAVDLPEWYLLEAMARWRVGVFGESLLAANVALERYRELGDSDGELRSQNVAAAGHFALGNLSEAAAGFARAAFLAAERNDTLMTARCVNNIGNVEHYLGRNAQALSSYGRAVTLFQQIEMLYGVAEAEHNRSVVLREEGDLVAAKQASDSALAAIERLGGGRALGWVLGGRGETDAMLGDLKLGEAQVRQSFTIATKHEDALTIVDAHRILAFIARLRGNLNDALATARRSEDLARDAGNPWMHAKVAMELARCYEARGLQDDSRGVWEQAANRFETVGAEARAADIRSDVARRLG